MDYSHIAIWMRLKGYLLCYDRFITFALCVCIYVCIYYFSFLFFMLYWLTSYITHLCLSLNEICKLDVFFLLILLHFIPQFIRCSIACRCYKYFKEKLSSRLVHISISIMIYIPRDGTHYFKIFVTYLSIVKTILTFCWSYILFKYRFGLFFLLN